MTLVQWEPFREMSRMKEQLNRALDEHRGRRWQEEGLSSAVSPPVDVYEDAEKLLLTVELPGVDPKDVDLRVENGILTLKAERKLEHEEKKENYLRVERWYGTFLRSFTLPSTADGDKVKADLKNGLLTITLPRREESKPRSIKVQAA